jgi:hypothetical protein
MIKISKMNNLSKYIFSPYYNAVFLSIKAAPESLIFKIPTNCSKSNLSKKIVFEKGSINGIFIKKFHFSDFSEKQGNLKADTNTSTISKVKFNNPFFFLNIFIFKGIIEQKIHENSTSNKLEERPANINIQEDPTIQEVEGKQATEKNRPEALEQPV